MVYLSHYEEYPIYEPAEGGYYYSGNQLVKSERMSLRQAKRRLAQLKEEAQKENDELSENIHDPNWKERVSWMFDYRCIWRNYNPDNRCCYIGTGESFVIERKQGSQSSGYEPYE